MVIYIAGSIPLFRGKRSNHFRLQRQSKHGALCRLKVRRLRRFPINLPLASLRAYLSGKPCIRPPRAKEPLKTETTAPPPTTDRKGKIIRWGYTGKQTAGTAIAERQTGRRTIRRRVFTEKIP
ncbi:MAG: hypothetical protein ACLRQN_11345 [Bacteroides faecis]